MNSPQQLAQGALVDAKYQLIYGNLWRYAQAILRDTTLPSDQLYAQLKWHLTAFWGLSALIPMGPDFPWHELPPLCGRYNAQETSWLEKGVVRIGTREEWHRAMDEVVIRATSAHIDPDCDLIVDLGCGWGHRMFDMWCIGIGSRARFIGGDRSEYSRRLVEDISRLFPEMRVDWFPFDFLTPDFRALPQNARNICVFTCCAIEQVQQIGSALFDALSEQFPSAKIRGVHLEPIAFQLAENYGPSPNVDVERDRRAARRKGYNLDLFAQIRGQPKLQVRVVDQALIDAGTGWCVSLLVWDRL